MKTYYVIRSGRAVLYAPGHYDLAGARGTMRVDQMRHPKSCYDIVRVVESHGAVETELTVDTMRAALARLPATQRPAAMAQLAALYCPRCGGAAPCHCT